MLAGALRSRWPGEVKVIPAAERRRGVRRQDAHRKHRGDWIDPRRGKVTLADVWADYERTGMGHLRETTKATYRNGLFGSVGAERSVWEQSAASR